MPDAKLPKQKRNIKKQRKGTWVSKEWWFGLTIKGKRRWFKGYTDHALTPVRDDDTETFELFTHNESARGEVVRTKKMHELTHGKRAPARAGAETA